MTSPHSPPTREVWLGANKRGLLLPFVPLALSAVAGLCLSTLCEHWVWRSLGALLALASLPLAAILLWLSRLPRLAYCDGELHVYVRKAAPLRVPLEIVECFLLGQGPGAFDSRGSRARMRNLVVRLSERAAEWSRLEVNPALGTWCDGYVTLYGAWCEPLDAAFVDRLNAKLHEAKRAPFNPQAVP